MLKMFVQSKSRMSPRHEYGLMCLTDTATWVRIFFPFLSLTCTSIKTSQAM
jgi:hypothetical protein